MYQRRFVLWDLVLFPTSDVKGVSTMLLAHIKYRIAHMLCTTLYAVKLLETLFCIKKCVSLPIRYDFIVIRLKGSPHQEVCEYSITTPPPLKHMNNLEDLKIL